MKWITCCLILLMPVAAAAQQSKEIPKPVMNGLAHDLAELQKAVVEAQRKQQQDLMAQFLTDAPTHIKVTGSSTPIRGGASKYSEILLQAEKGRTYRVIDKAGPWYAVKLDSPHEGIPTGWISATGAVPVANLGQSSSGGTVPDETLAEEIFKSLTEQATHLRDAYRNNPYINVSGFTVNVGVPPSVSISFEFKK